MKLSEVFERLKTMPEEANLFIVDEEKTTYRLVGVSHSGDGLEVHLHVIPE